MKFNIMKASTGESYIKEFNSLEELKEWQLSLPKYVPNEDEWDLEEDADIMPEPQLPEFICNFNSEEPYQITIIDENIFN